MHHMLLGLVAVALVTAPLRSGLAHTHSAAGHAAAPCVHMQAGAHAMHHVEGMPAQHSISPLACCDRDCAGGDCDGSCKTCAHASVALTAATVLTAFIPGDVLYVALPECLSGYIHYPLFRPPIRFS